MFILVGGLAMVLAVGACGESDGVANSTAARTAATESAGTVASTGGATATTEPSAAAEDSNTSPPSASPGPSSATEPAVVSFEVDAYEWQFKPDSWTVAAGEDFTIQFNNVGGAEHDLAILALGEGITKMSEFEDDMVLFHIESVPRQGSVTDTFRIDEPGTYQVICTLSGHFNSGMAGTLEVR